MSTYQLAQRVYWRLLPVPFLGRRLHRAVDGAKEAVRKVAIPSLDAMRETLQLHTSALAGLRDSLSYLRDDAARTLSALDELRHTSGDLRHALDELRLALDQEQRVRETSDGGLRDVAQRLAARLQELDVREAAVERRLEFVREETLFELRALTKAKPNPTSAPVHGEIVNLAKFSAMSGAGAVKVNVGCGHVMLEDYLNVDQRRLPGVDVVGEATALPFAPGTVSELYSAHLLEHFPIDQLRRVVLPYWMTLLEPGGTLRAVVPDAEAMIAAHMKGEMSFEDLRVVTFGLQEYEGDFHYTMFSRDSLRAVLEEVGLRDVEFAVTGRPNGKCLEMEIRGTKGTT